MGSPISSTMAEVYLQYTEETYIKQWLESKEILYYKRYIDDILIIYIQNKINEQTILEEINKIDQNLQFKMCTEEDNIINYLDITIHRNNNNIDISTYRKPTGTDTPIQFSSNHPYEHKIAAFKYYIHRMLTLPITEESQQEEWKTIITMAKNNGCPVGIINDLRTKLTSKKHQQHPPTTPYNKRNWVTFNYYSPMIRRIINLFKHTDLNIAFRATNTLQQQLSKKQNNTNPSGIYKLKCNTCNKAYIGQSGSP